MMCHIIKFREDTDCEERKKVLYESLYCCYIVVYNTAVYTTLTLSHS